jgi:hypothetical protein
LAREHELDSIIETVGHGAADAVSEGAQGLRFDADYVFSGAVHAEG